MRDDRPIEADCIYSNEMLNFSLIESDTCELILPYFHYRLVEINISNSWVTKPNKKGTFRPRVDRLVVIRVTNLLTTN